jgi:hypothetical protein
MNYLLPIVVGTTAFVYVHSFNYLKKLYEKNDRLMSFKDLAKIAF